MVGASGHSGLHCSAGSSAACSCIIRGGKAFAQVGGGIVADSDPQAEWNETLVKARALLAGIKATNSVQRKVSKNANRCTQNTNYGKSFSKL